MLEHRLFLERGEKYGPGDKLPSVGGPLEFLVGVFPIAVSRVSCMEEAIQGRADVLAGGEVDVVARSWEDDDLVDRS